MTDPVIPAHFATMHVELSVRRVIDDGRAARAPAPTESLEAQPDVRELMALPRDPAEAAR